MVEVGVRAAYILEMVGYSSPPSTQGFPPGFQILFPRAFDALREVKFAGESVVALTNSHSRRLGRGLESAARGLDTGLQVLPLEIPRWYPRIRIRKRRATIAAPPR